MAVDLTAAVVTYLQTHGTLDAAGFGALFAVFAVTGLAPIPRTALCLASGAIYGPAAIFVIMPSTTISSVVAFYLARYLLSAPLYRFAGRRRRWRAILNAVDEEGWRIVGLMRFGSAMPTFMQNYLFGLTRIKARSYILATFFFTVPQVCLYVYLGALGRAALISRDSSGWSLALAGLAAICMLTVALIVAARARSALRADGIETSRR